MSSRVSAAAQPVRVSLMQLILETIGNKTNVPRNDFKKLSYFLSVIKPTDYCPFERPIWARTLAYRLMA